MKFQTLILSCIVSGVILVSAGHAQTATPSPKIILNTQCTVIKVCYCVNNEFLPLIDEKVKLLRQKISDERAKGKAIGYFSVPLSTRAGGYFDVNVEISGAAKDRIEARMGKDHAWVLNPAMKEVDLKSPSGAFGGHGEYMLMWTRVMEGDNGMGEDFDFVYFAGPTDFAPFFGLTGKSDMDVLAKYFDDRLASDANLKKEVARGRVTRQTFRNYYALRASVAFSNGAHDEWNIVRIINERRRANEKFGNTGQMPVLFDGKAVSAGEFENAIAAGSLGACKVQ